MAASNPKKRERSGFDEFAEVTPVKQARHAHQGLDFQKAILKLSRGKIEDVSRKVTLPIAFGTASVPKSHDLVLDSAFTTRTHWKDGHQWTQGWLELGGSTTYENILPDTLTLQRAQAEGHVMKKLALGEGYMPKNPLSFVGVTNSIADLKPRISGWGRPALQSYLEEVTGRTSLSVNEIGSGMRAMMLASKMRMKNAGTVSEGSFKSRMLASFPQLLTKDSTPTPGGASLLNTNIYDEQQASPGVITPTQTQIAKSAIRAHKEVNYEIRKRFDQKWNAIASGATAQATGNWWASKFSGGKFGVGTKGFNEMNAHLSQSRITKKTLRAQYVSDKLAKYGITHYKGG